MKEIKKTTDHRSETERNAEESDGTMEEITALRLAEETADDKAFAKAIAKKKEQKQCVTGETVHMHSAPADEKNEDKINFPEDDFWDKSSIKHPVETAEGDAQDVTWDFPLPEKENTTDEADDLLHISMQKEPAKAASLYRHAVSPQKRHRALPKKHLLWIIPAACVLLLLIGYLIFVFCPIPFIRNLRNVYIGTAMTTGDHQWLATSFMPSYIIDEVMNVPLETEPLGYTTDLVRRTESVDSDAVTIDSDTTIESATTKEQQSQNPSEIKVDILGLADLKVGEKDSAGNKVLIVDEEEGLYVAEISGSGYMGTGYKGRVMLIDDPSRVFIGVTPEKTQTGYRIPDMMSSYGDIIAGINASGFHDPNDSGDGKDIIGFCMSEGESWGKYVSNMASIVLTEDNKLVVDYISDWDSYNIRDGMQFGPAPILFAGGKRMVDEKNGLWYGIHPRTAIGQREDGVIILLVIDGRDITYSVGCTMNDLGDIMEAYGAVNAGCCDGGSSCVLAYDGKVINRNSSLNPKYGRRIPNAFLVRSKKTESHKTT